MVLPHSLIILIESSSQPCALSVLSLRISFSISVSSIAISLNLLFVQRISDGNTLLLGIIEHCSTNSALKMSALAWKLVIKTPFSRNGGITGFFLLRMFFSVVQ